MSLYVDYGLLSRRVHAEVCTFLLISGLHIVYFIALSMLSSQCVLVQSSPEYSQSIDYGWVYSYSETC